MIERAEIAVRPYRRPFARPLKAAWGTWSVREGLLVRLRDPVTGKTGFGEAAPLGQELRQILALACPSPSPESLAGHRATTFALWAAQRSLAGPEGQPPPAVRSAALLSLGNDTGCRIRHLRESGFRTCKLKVGLNDLNAEWKSLQAVALSLQEGEKLRLDPNRSWKEDDWKFWKPRLNGLSEWIQFIEEPFVRGIDRSQMLREARNSPVPLALDESLAEGNPAEWTEIHWPGYWIVKPSLMGSPTSWMAALKPYAGKVVISSVFETGIGLSALAGIADCFPGLDHGLGTNAYFEDAFGASTTGSDLKALSVEQQEALWKNLPGK